LGHKISLPTTPLVYNACSKPEEIAYIHDIYRKFNYNITLKTKYPHHQNSSKIQSTTETKSIYISNKYHVYISTFVNTFTWRHHLNNRGPLGHKISLPTTPLVYNACSKPEERVNVFAKCLRLRVKIAQRYLFLKNKSTIAYIHDIYRKFNYNITLKTKYPHHRMCLCL
jgi:hypothetical protein